MAYDTKSRVFIFDLTNDATICELLATCVLCIVCLHLHQSAVLSHNKYTLDL